MPDWLTIVLALGGSTLISSIVGYIFNFIVNRPKQKKLERQQEEEKRRKELEALKQELLVAVEEVKTEKIRERAACQEDHCALVKMVKDIQSTNNAQNAGLQSVLKDLLKIRYLEWITKGYAPMDARDDLEKMYQAYHKLGANGVMDAIRKQFMDLPIKSMAPKENNKLN